MEQLVVPLVNKNRDKHNTASTEIATLVSPCTAFGKGSIIPPNVNMLVFVVCGGGLHHEMGKPRQA